MSRKALEDPQVAPDLCDGFYVLVDDFGIGEHRLRGIADDEAATDRQQRARIVFYAIDRCITPLALPGAASACAVLYQRMSWQWLILEFDNRKAFGQKYLLKRFVGLVGRRQKDLLPQDRSQTDTCDRHARNRLVRRVLKTPVSC